MTVRKSKEGTCVCNKCIRSFCLMDDRRVKEFISVSGLHLKKTKEMFLS